MMGAGAPESESHAPYRVSGVTARKKGARLRAWALKVGTLRSGL